MNQNSKLDKTLTKEINNGINGMSMKTIIVNGFDYNMDYKRLKNELNNNEVQQTLKNNNITILENKTNQNSFNLFAYNELGHLLKSDRSFNGFNDILKSYSIQPIESLQQSKLEGGYYDNTNKNYFYKYKKYKNKYLKLKKIIN